MTSKIKGYIWNITSNHIFNIIILNWKLEINLNVLEKCFSHLGILYFAKFDNKNVKKLSI